MNTVILPSVPKQSIGAFPRNRDLLRAVLLAGKAAFGLHVRGLTRVTATHAILQAIGDSTVYAVELTASQAAQLGWIDLSQVQP